MESSSSSSSPSGTFQLAKTEACLRVLSIVLLVLSACLIRFDTQTTLIFSTVEMTATFKNLGALQVAVYAFSVAAVYNLLQLTSGFLTAKLKTKLVKLPYVTLCWVSFLLDQGAVYMVFATNTATLQGAMIAKTGESSLQWMKVCNKFPRFCFQIGAALLGGYLASLVLALLSSLTAFSLFRLYSPEQFLVLKHT